MGNPIISARNVCFKYDDADHYAVENVSLEIDEGEFVVVLGRNGSGKSTFAKLLNALLIPTSGTVTVDGTKYALRPLDVLYVGKGAKRVTFASKSAKKPAAFYLASYPAHKEYPTKLIKFEDANHRHLGTVEDCNVRTIHQFILPGKCDSCQLVMGFTRLEPGSNWNTMPAHTHERRTEMYMYFDIAPDATVFHFMGAGDETRHLAMHNHDVVVSPMWSIHAGVGTRAYTFCWAMGGENQVFDDMDGIAVADLR
jgi:4-deoxy-L-threo-5-hexosulose-uronate ketol-isomerase